MSGRGPFRIVWRDFLNWWARKNTVHFVGEDMNGTKYYIREKENGRGRFCEPLDKDNVDVEIPNEWESWLRYRRREPPTVEEIAKRMEIDRVRIENAMRLLDSQPKKEVDEKVLAKPESGKSSFPDYGDYYKK